MRIRHRIVALLLGTALVGTGCGMQEEAMSNEINYISNDPVHFTGMCGDEAEIAYVAPMQLPEILVNTVGYNTAADKKILFRSKKASGKYYVVDVNTGQTVYEGVVQNAKYNEQTEEYISVADISGVQTPGEYIVQNELVGESYSFAIGDGVREELLAQQINELWQEFDTYIQNNSYRSGDLVRISGQLVELFAAYDFYPKLFRDKTVEVLAGNGIPDVLDMTEKVVEWFLNLQNVQFSGRDRVCFAGILAKFSQIYKEFDNSVSSNYIRKATEWYDAGMKTGEEIPVEIGLYTTISMYQMQGNSKYHTAAKEYMEQAQNLRDMDSFYLQAFVNYVSGKRSVDTTKCSRFMTELMSAAEACIVRCRKNEYKVCDTSRDLIIQNMNYLVIANYVLESEEYHTIMENHFNYLCGCNPKAKLMLEGIGEMRAAFILYLGGLINCEK